MTQLSMSSILLLYAVSVIYMDVLRLPRDVAVASYRDPLRRADGLLEHYDHPAAQVARVSLSSSRCITWPNVFANHGLATGYVQGYAGNYTCASRVIAWLIIEMAGVMISMYRVKKQRLI
jgi:hypothetical protein